MDALIGLLDAPRARGAFALRVVMTAPWSLRILAESPVTLLAGVTGQTWVVPDAGEAVRIGPGDIVVTRAPVHYNVADSPTTAPRLVIHPGQDCRDLHGNSVRGQLTHGVRTWGNDPRGEDVFLVGAYEHLSDVSDRLLRALPPVLSLSHAEWKSPLVPLLLDEVIKDEPRPGRRAGSVARFAARRRAQGLVFAAALERADLVAVWRRPGRRACVAHHA